MLFAAEGGRVSLTNATADLEVVSADQQPSAPDLQPVQRRGGAAPSELADGLLPYRSAREHLLDLLDRLDGRLRRELALGHPRSVMQMLSLTAISGDEVDRLLSPGDGPSSTEGVQALALIERSLAECDERIRQRVASSQSAGVGLPMLELARRFGLSELETDLVIGCLAAEVDRRYERIYGYLQDDLSRKAPSAGLLLALFTDDRHALLAARAALQPLAALRYFRILEVADEDAPNPLLSRPLAIDERIASFLLGQNGVDARIAPFVLDVEAPTQGAGLTRKQREGLPALVAHATRCLRAAGGRERLLVYLHGPRRAGVEAMVAEAARALQLPVLAVDAEALAAAGGDFEGRLFLLFREGLLVQAVVYLQNLDRVLEQDPSGGRYNAIVRWAGKLAAVVFASGEQPWRWSAPPVPLLLRTLELQSEGLREQIHLWQALAGEQVPEADLHRLVSRHSLQPGAIAAAWRAALVSASLRGVDAVVSAAELDAACRAQSPLAVSGLARRIVPRHDWSDLVLPPTQREQLRDLCSQARNLSTVYGVWGFERKLSLGKGLSAMFSGPPGTGKTLAAEVIAAELDMEILAIDLSQVVSKYIGETEKNLRQLFDQAASARAILFFDEADALLGKRSDVKDARDRYANTEVAYLLQKMDEYEGITILATNLRQNMDEAFTRRLRFIVEFPFPEEVDRLRIWEGVWPTEVPRAADVDLPSLARQFRMSGGNIRNIALAAAFLAADQGQAVSMRHLQHAARRELLKMGRLITDPDPQLTAGGAA